MYSDVFCKVYNEFGWNYYPEIFGQRLLNWMEKEKLAPKNALDLGCGTGILCRILQEHGICASGMDLSEGMIAIAQAENPQIPFAVADMLTYAPSCGVDLVTCTGDAFNHIPDLDMLAQIFRNVYGYTNPGGYFVFDILDEKEVSDSEPFEMDHDEHTRVWFQMTRPSPKQVNLQIRVYDGEQLQLEENIRETVHDPEKICELVTRAGFTLVRCAHNLLPEDHPGTTWFVIAKK